MHYIRAQLCLQLGHCNEPEIKNACPPDVWTQWGKERVAQTERVALTYVQCVCVCVCVCVRARAQSCVVFATPWTAARQAPLSVGFSRQEYWSGLPFPSPGDLPRPGTEPGSPALQADYQLSHQGGPIYALLLLLLLLLSHFSRVRLCATP